MGLKYKWKIYIVSIKEDIDRRSHVENVTIKAKSRGFDVEIIDAIYWKTQNVFDKLNEHDITFIHNGWLSQSQLACFLSHRLAWLKMLEVLNSSSETKCIVLEDDVGLLEFETFLSMETDICKIEPYDGIIMWKHPEKIPNKLDFICDNFVSYYFQWGLVAYHISSKQLCEEMINIKCIDQPIDDLLYSKIFPKYNVVFTANDPFLMGYLEGNQVKHFKSNITGQIT